jgi:type VI secretion system protein VasG
LNETCQSALQGAAGLCLSRTNYDIELEHLLVKLLEVSDTDLTKILRQYELNPSRLSKDITVAMEKLKTGNTRTPGIAREISDLIQNAWLLASVEFGEAKIRSGHLLLALLTNETLARLAREITKDFAKINVDELKENFAALTNGSSEARAAEGFSSQPMSDSGGDATAPGIAAAGKTKALDQFTIDLTARAKAGKIDPVLGRDFEVRQVIDILTRRRQNNPILTGEAGVGKTAVVEGFALRIAQGDVPEPLRNVALRTLDLGLLQAGAGVKGEFENRLKTVIEEVKSSPQPIIIFIDEAHTMIGAGGQAGQNDAANLLKPALGRTAHNCRHDLGRIQKIL